MTAIPARFLAFFLLFLVFLPEEQSDHPDPSIVGREVEGRVVVLVGGGDVRAGVQQVRHARLVPLCM